VLALALAPAAHAQITCSEVNRLNTEAVDGFHEISGLEIGDYIFFARFRISGAKDCQIDLDIDATYLCEWQYREYSEASAALRSQSAALTSCLAGWPAGNKQVETSSDIDGYRSIGGMYWMGKGANDDLAWSTELEEHIERGAGAHYHLWIKLLSFY
jgi:hypothetical protein